MDDSASAREWLEEASVASVLDDAVAEVLRRRPTGGRDGVVSMLAEHFAKEAASKGTAAPAPAAGDSSVAGQSISFIHFNDVYNAEQQSGLGGGSRFVRAIQETKKQHRDAEGSVPIVVFSGDAFNPSLMSRVTKGAHMVPVLNNCEVECALIGNHDFDFGVDALEAWARASRFPWLISNVKLKSTGQPPGSAEAHIIDNAGRTNHRVGIMGLVEHEWLATLSVLDESDTLFEDYCSCARRLSASLRAQGCTVVVALTHMRQQNDEMLAEQCGDCFDVILGGHDHDYRVSAHGPHDTVVVKSGTDFFDFSVVTIRLDQIPSVETRRVHVDPVSFPEVDRETEAQVKAFSNEILSMMDEPIGGCLVDLECRFACIRTRETNAANLIADIMRRATSADVALLNSGTLRADRVFPAGEITYRDLVSLLPLLDGMVVISLTGSALIAALENGISKYPRLEGRFPCVSGVRFSFRHNAESLNELVDVSVRGEPIDPERMYSVATKGYLAAGKDGYTSFVGAKVLVDAEDAPDLSTCVQNCLSELRHLLSQAAHCGHRRGTLRGLDEWEQSGHVSYPLPQGASPLDPIRRRASHPSAISVEPLLSPAVDGRLVCINPVDQ
ncbi:Mannosylglucosyl-3-phosphoglycerate phosphatase [Diplonema papillatum]|nr:Mannosylglucosyl-3-phosphoglycerate phosphatase [Diplonema papillatum]